MYGNRNLSIEVEKQTDGTYRVYIGEENSSGWTETISDISELGNVIDMYIESNPIEE